MQKNRIGYTSVMFWSDFTSYADTSDCIVSFLLLPYTEAHVRYDLAAFSCMTRSRDSFMYNINLWATHTTILSTRGVQIPIDLVSSATDSIRRHVVLFKHVPIPTSDPKSEFLCQSSFSCAEPADPPEPPCMPGISPTPLSTRIIHTAPVLVLSPSTSRLSLKLNMLNDLVTASQLKLSRMFSSNVTTSVTTGKSNIGISALVNTMEELCSKVQEMGCHCSIPALIVY